MQGLPASGKSTSSKKLVDENGNYGRINRDDLRAMIFNSKWSPQREKIIVEIEKAIASVLLQNNVSPIIDDTNLSSGHIRLWKDFSLSKNCNADIISMGASVELSVERDALRPTPVGKAIIHKMALNNNKIKWGNKNIVIVDLDGTLCDDSYRESFLHKEDGTKEWNKYFSMMETDTPVDIVYRWVKELSKDYTIVIMTGRPDNYQFETLRWLQKYEIPYNYIFMRASSDKRPDVLVKNDILSKLPRERIYMALDDRPSVINEVWRKNGIKVIPVRGDIEPF